MKREGPVDNRRAFDVFGVDHQIDHPIISSPGRQIDQEVTRSRDQQIVSDLPQALNRIDVGGPAHRQPGRGDRRGQRQRGGAEIGRRIGGGDAEQHRTSSPAPGRGRRPAPATRADGGQPDAAADRRWRRSPAPGRRAPAARRSPACAGSPRRTSRRRARWSPAAPRPARTRRTCPLSSRFDEFSSAKPSLGGPQLVGRQVGVDVADRRRAAPGPAPPARRPQHDLQPPGRPVLVEQERAPARAPGRCRGWRCRGPRRPRGLERRPPSAAARRTMRAERRGRIAPVAARRLGATPPRPARGDAASAGCEGPAGDDRHADHGEVVGRGRRPVRPTADRAASARGRRCRTASPAGSAAPAAPVAKAAPSTPGMARGPLEQPPAQRAARRRRRRPSRSGRRSRPRAAAPGRSRDRRGSTPASTGRPGRPPPAASPPATPAPPPAPSGRAPRDAPPTLRAEASFSELRTSRREHPQGRDDGEDQRGEEGEHEREADDADVEGELAEERLGGHRVHAAESAVGDGQAEQRRRPGR